MRQSSSPLGLGWIIFFFFIDPATTEIYTLSLHDALPICRAGYQKGCGDPRSAAGAKGLRARVEDQRGRGQQAAGGPVRPGRDARGDDGNRYYRWQTGALFHASTAALESPTSCA